MKSIWLLLSVVFALALPVHGGKPSHPDPDEWVPKILEGKAPIKDVLACLKADWRESEKPGHDGEVALPDPDVFRAACFRATEPQLAELAGLLAKYPKGQEEFFQNFNAYAMARFRLQVAQWKAHPKKVSLEPSAPGPAALAELPKELATGWTASRTVLAPYRKLFPPAPAPAEAPPSPEPAAVESILRRLLADPKDPAWKDLLPMKAILLRQSGNDALPRSLDFAILNTLCAQEDLPAALGACLELAPRASYEGNFRWQDLPASQRLTTDTIDFLRGCGVPWEPVFLGLLVPENFSAPSDLKIGATAADLNAWRTLATYGSADTIRLGLNLVAKQHVAAELKLEFLLTAAGPFAGKEFSSDGPYQARLLNMQARKEKLAKPVRAEAIEAIRPLLDPKRPILEIFEILTSLPTSLGQPLRTSLLPLLKHPSHRLGSAARDLLVRAKAVPEDAPITPAPPPLRFVLKDDKPVANASVQVEAGDEGLDTVTTDADGRLSIPLDDVLEPELIRSIRLKVGPLPDEPPISAPAAAPVEAPPVAGAHPPDSGKPDPSPPAAAVAEAAPPQEWPGPWIDITVPVEVGKDAEREVVVKTAALEITFAPGPGLAADAAISAQLYRFPRAKEEPEGRLTMSSTSSGTLTFRRLQTGNYQVVVEPGACAGYVSKPIALGNQGSIRLLTLETARQVRGTVVFPNGVEQTLDFAGTVVPVGADVPLGSTPGEGFRGLVPGKYVFKVNSSAEELQRLRESGMPLEVAQNRGAHAALSREFEVLADSPATIDLGKLVVPPPTK